MKMRVPVTLKVVVALLVAIANVTSAQTLQTLHSFSASEGTDQVGGLSQGADGNFYGTLSSGSEFHAGSIFRMEPGGTVTVLHTFSGGADGAGPVGQLLQLRSGDFYGVTVTNPGTIFKITAEGVLTTL